MDPIIIPTLVTSVWTMLQPYLPTIASKAAEKVGESLPAAVGKAWETIQKKFATKPAAQETTQELLKKPADADVQGAFRLQLKKALEEDQPFALDLEKLLKAAGVTFDATLTGDGAIALGNGAVAVGAGGVHVGGNALGNTFVTGKNNRVRKG